MALEFIFNVLEIPFFLQFIIRLTMVGPGEKSFEVNALKWLENPMLKFDFSNTAFYQRAIVLLLKQNLEKVYYDLKL